MRPRAQTFNSRMCQLVLGAGAMTVAGLKSITAKHLALSAQGAGAVRALHPILLAVLTEHVPQSRRALLVPDFARLLQARPHSSSGTITSQYYVRSDALTTTIMFAAMPCQSLWFPLQHGRPYKLTPAIINHRM